MYQFVVTFTVRIIRHAAGYLLRVCVCVNAFIAQNSFFPSSFLFLFSSLLFHESHYNSVKATKKTTTTFFSTVCGKQRYTVYHTHKLTQVCIAKETTFYCGFESISPIMLMLFHSLASSFLLLFLCTFILIRRGICTMYTSAAAATIELNMHVWSFYSYHT